MRPQISLAMMVKNEEDFLEDALLSAKPWVDELIVVDTGSTDRTVEIAKDLGAVVSFFEWPDSFSIARNETLKRANGEWIFVLDADERIRGENPEGLREHLVKGPEYPYEAILLNVINIAQDGRSLSSSYGPRIFPKNENIRYGGRVHNSFQSFDPDHPTITARYVEGIEILHLGYDNEIYKERKKTERSLPLILASIEDNPNDGAMKYYLGREYMRISEYGKAVTALSDAIETMNRNPDHSNLAEASWLALVKSALQAKFPFEEVMKIASNALKLFPTNPDLWNATAGVLIVGHKPEEAINCLLQAQKNLKDGWSDAERSQGLSLRSWELNERLALSYGELGRWKESYECFLKTIDTRPRDIPGWQAVIDTTVSLAEQLGDSERVELLKKIQKESQESNKGS